MSEVILNIFPVETKPKRLNVYRITKTLPETRNRTTKFRLAANIAKGSADNENPVFSVGEEIFSLKEIRKKFSEKIDLEGTTVPFDIEVEKIEEIDVDNIEHGKEALVNRLVDWFYKENIPKSFRVENVNYEGVNLFSRLESRLYKTFKININQGILRATRIFAGKPYLLLDVDYRVTWEESLWESVKFFAKNTLNKDPYLPDVQTINAINERFGRNGKKPGVQVQGKNQVGEYEVLAFDFTKNPDTPNIVGQMSQREYFSKVYGNETQIKDDKQPLVVVKNLRGYYREGQGLHVPELLEFGRIPRQLKTNENLMSAVLNIEKPIPRGRYSQIINLIQGDPFSSAKGFAENDFVNKFGVFSKEPLTVCATRLPPIKVRMGEESFSVSSDSDFLGNIWKRKFHRVPSVNQVVLIYDKNRHADVSTFYCKLQQVAGDQGLILPEANIIEIDEETPEALIKAIGNEIKADIVISFTAKGNDDFYDTVKEELLINHGVLSQNISYENTLDVIADCDRKGKAITVKSILTLIAMQLCAKLGGAPWAFSEPIYKKNMPIMGLDVFHELDGSITASCTVFDPYGEYLFSDARITNLEELLTTNLKRYINSFGKPDGLLIIRDGLSFAQEQKFLSAPGGELDVIKIVMQGIELNNWTLAMEKKSTHLRMYKKLGGIKVDNPDPGTVIIGYPFENNEMLMVCQQTYAGTVSPIFYKIIIPSEPDMLVIANAINKLCRHHWNTNKAIKIPAPAEHADRITYLVRRILSSSPKNPDVLNKPFYL